MRAPRSTVHTSGGKWNYSSLGSNGTSNSAASSGGANAGALNVHKLAINNGRITVSVTGAQQRPSIYEDLKLEVSDLSYTSQFPFELSAKGPGNAAFKIQGKAGPVNPSDSSLTPLSASIEVQHLDLATTGFIDPSSGIAGLLDFKGDLNSDGKQINSKGSITATKLKASAAGSPSTVPVNIDYATVYTIHSQAGVLNTGDIKIGNAVQHLTGNFNTTAEPTKIDMKLNAQGMPVGDLEGFLPAVGVVLPSGSKLQGGTVSVNMAIVGPVDKLTISGPVNLSNTRLAGFSLKSKLGALGPFAGLGGGGGNDTEIQTLSATIHNDPSGTKFDSIDLVLPTIGTVTGNGTVSASGQLDFKMAANLSGGLGKGIGAVTNVAGGATGALSSLAGGGGRTAGKSSNGGIPFTIHGTTSSPQVLPDMGGAIGSVAKGVIPGKVNPANAATKSLGGLLGKKKP